MLVASVTIATAPGTAHAARSSSPPPSAADVETSKAQVHAKALALAQVKVQLAEARARLTSLDVHVEVAIEAYDGAQLKLAQAQRGVADADQGVVAARQRLRDTQSIVDGMAADAYMRGGPASDMAAAVGAGDLSSIMDAHQALRSASEYQAQALTDVSAAQHAATEAQAAAAQRAAGMQQATAAAADARRSAVVAVQKQATTIRTIGQLEAQVESQLSVAQQRADKLARARTAWLQEQARERARRIAAQRVAAARAAEQRAAEQRAAEQRAEQRAAEQRAEQRAAEQRAAERAVAADAAAEPAPQPTGDGGSAAGDTGPATFSPPAYSGGAGQSSAEQGRIAVQAAYTQLGVPYSWGGGDLNGPTLGFAEAGGITVGATTVGFDCSGLTMYAWGKAGVFLGHWTGAQWDAGSQVPHGSERPGDLLFFATNTNDPSTIHHVGIYIGDGQMIDAPETGSFVRVDAAFRSDLIGVVRP